MINCIITSSKGTVTYKEVKNITLPTLSGQMQILSGYAESFILLKKGEIYLEQLNKGSELIQSTDGECHIKNDVVIIIL